MCVGVLGQANAGLGQVNKETHGVCVGGHSVREPVQENEQRAQAVTDVYKRVQAEGELTRCLGLLRCAWLVQVNWGRCTKGGMDEERFGSVIVAWHVVQVLAQVDVRVWHRAGRLVPRHSVAGGGSCLPLRPTGLRALAKGRSPKCFSFLPLFPGADLALCPLSSGPSFAMASQPQPLHPALPCASATGAGGAGLVAGSPEKGLSPRGREIGTGGFASLVCAGKPALGMPGTGLRSVLSLMHPAGLPWGAWRGCSALPTWPFSSPCLSCRQRSPQASCPAQTPGPAQASCACQALPAAPPTGAAAPSPGAALCREDEPPGRAPALQWGQWGGGPQAPLLHPQVTRDP